MQINFWKEFIFIDLNYVCTLETDRHGFKVQQILNSYVTVWVFFLFIFLMFLRVNVDFNTYRTQFCKENR